MFGDEATELHMIGFADWLFRRGRFGLLHLFPPLIEVARSLRLASIYLNPASAWTETRIVNQRQGKEAALSGTAPSFRLPQRFETRPHFTDE